jgi:acetolactate synthase-1/2/3 large subunit
VTAVTVADVVADACRRAGTPRGFHAPGGRPAGRHGVEMVATPGAPIMAAVTGVLADAPGLAIVADGDLEAARGAAWAAREGAPLVLIVTAGSSGALAGAPVKGRVVLEPASAGHWIAHALQLAMAEPRGPVHAALAAVDGGAPALPVAAACRPASPPPPSEASLDAAAAALGAAARPVLVLGRGCRRPGCAPWVRAFAEALPAPAIATASGKGALPDPHPLALGTPGTTGDLLARADLVVLVGVETDEWPGPPVWPSRLAFSRVPGGAPGAGPEVVGDLALSIEELAPRLRDRPRADWDVALLDRLKREGAARTRERAANAGALIALAREATPVGTVATADGAVAEPAALAWQSVAPAGLLLPGPAPLAGFAIAAAVAAHAHDPRHPVVAFTDAEGLAAAVPEWSLAEARGLPVIVAAFDGGDGSASTRAAAERALLAALAQPGPRVVHLPG